MAGMRDTAAERREGGFYEEYDDVDEVIEKSHANVDEVIEDHFAEFGRHHFKKCLLKFENETISIRLISQLEKLRSHLGLVNRILAGDGGDDDVIIEDVKALKYSKKTNRKKTKDIKLKGVIYTLSNGSRLVFHRIIDTIYVSVEFHQVSEVNVVTKNCPELRHIEYFANQLPKIACPGLPLRDATGKLIISIF